MKKTLKILNVCNEQINIKNIKNRHFKYKIKMKYLCFKYFKFFMLIINKTYYEMDTKFFFPKLIS